MPPLLDNSDQLLLFQPNKMRGGCRGAQIGDNRELGCSSSPAVQQRKEHLRSPRVPYGCSNCVHALINLWCYVHSSPTSEVLFPDKCHTTKRGGCGCMQRPSLN